MSIGSSVSPLPARAIRCLLPHPLINPPSLLLYLDTASTEWSSSASDRGASPFSGSARLHDMEAAMGQIMQKTGDSSHRNAREATPAA